MLNRLFAFFALIAAAFSASGAFAAEGPEVRTDNVAARLVSDVQAVAPGEPFNVALVLTMDEHWHTYWRNPGDAGEPTRITWSLPAGYQAGEFVWPTPHALPFEGVLTNYGYEDELVLPMAMETSRSVGVGQEVTLEAAVTWLECYDICIPGSADLTLTLPVVEASPAPDRRWAPRIAETLQNAPRQEGLEAGLERLEDGAARLSVRGDALAAALDAGEVNDPYFFPFEGSHISHNAEQPAVFGRSGLALTLTPAFGLRDQLVASPGVLSWTDAAGALRGVEITAEPTGGVDIGPILASGGSGGGGVVADGGVFAGSGDFFSGGGGLIGLMIAGVLGGLILNLMPCVFPVLFIKALSLVQKAHGAPAVVRRNGLIFLAGVLSTFAVLAGVLIGMKAFGAAVGWGFQLQNPVFVAAMALLMFAIGLNLLGVFDVGGSVQGLGSGLADRGGSVGAFFTGVLAVVVATPCTAPFMAGALGFALGQPAYVSLAVFLSIGLGLALPFLALSFAPGLMRALPKPGAWMDTLKQFFAFPMFLTAVWLVWVLAQQAGETGVLAVLGAMTAFGFMIWTLKAARGSGRLIALAGRAAAVALFLLALVGVGATPVLAPTPAQASALEEEAWSPARVAELRAEGRPVFVDFTAAWCITCQFNKRNALTRAGVQSVFAENDVAFLTADWTNNDPVITQELERYGRSGVPLYLLLPPQGEAVILPQLLTERIVIDAVEGLAG